jgi:hypothetical protein
VLPIPRATVSITQSAFTVNEEAAALELWLEQGEAGPFEIVGVRS